MERDGDTSKINGEAQHLQEEAKQLKGTIWLDAFSCDACNQPPKPFHLPGSARLDCPSYNCFRNRSVALYC
jgi:hypothetical protein